MKTIWSTILVAFTLTWAQANLGDLIDSIAEPDLGAKIAKAIEEKKVEIEVVAEVAPKVEAVPFLESSLVYRDSILAASGSLDIGSIEISSALEVFPAFNKAEVPDYFNLIAVGSGYFELVGMLIYEDDVELSFGLLAMQ